MGHLHQTKFASPTIIVFFRMFAYRQADPRTAVDGFTLHARHMVKFAAQRKVTGDRTAKHVLALTDEGKCVGRFLKQIKG